MINKLNRKFRDGDHVCFSNQNAVGVINGIPYKDNKPNVYDDNSPSYYVVWPGISANHITICREKDLRFYSSKV